jgi:Ser/Thr protein kinase RdoA (MazF antagonist)
LDTLIATAAGQFSPQGNILSILPYGSGNVHDTFLVTLAGATENKFILQRLNTRIFSQPERVMQNIRTLSEHARNQLHLFPQKTGRQWEVPQIITTLTGFDLWKDPNGSIWRALSFINRARSFDTIQDLDHAREVGYALGMFHRLTHNLPVESLFDTLEGFHITPGYLRHFDQFLSERKIKKSPELAFCLRFVTRRRTTITVLERAREQGRLQLRPIHGDPKVNNVMIDTVTRQAVSLVDLDTVKPGLIHYDIGDCLRSCANPLGEETERWEEVRFQPDLCRAILEGYLDQTRDHLNDYDYAYLFEAVRLIALELGLRFLTDFLEGNIYFKVKDPRQNLIRALVQFKLTESIESQEPEIQTIIKEQIPPGVTH